ncbi:MAG TPA: hypothetical protein VM925_15770 [Labilithrix sp.]|nr:hypothetical protein [Labilithrix sp.]
MHVFRLKVRRAPDARNQQRVFVWGSEGATTPLPAKSPLLSVRVDDDGEPLELIAVGPGETSLAKLRPGEGYTVELAGHRGVCAIANQDTFVTCILHEVGA